MSKKFKLDCRITKAIVSSVILRPSSMAIKARQKISRNLMKIKSFRRGLAENDINQFDQYLEERSIFSSLADAMNELEYWTGQKYSNCGKTALTDQRISFPFPRISESFPEVIFLPRMKFHRQKDPKRPRGIH